jgi:glycosyltransferase involved in cell wall biosynthesis
MSDPQRVLLTTEGTYPFHGGGVSTWCDALTSHLPEIDFTLLAVTMHPYVQQKYPLPANVTQLVTIPLWGIEEPAEYSWDAPFSTVLRRRWDTTEQIIATEFLPCFERFIELAIGGSRDVPALAGATYSLYDYVQRYDYHHTLQTPEAWKSFHRTIDSVRRRGHLAGGEPTFGELAEALRLLYRFFLVLNVPVIRADVAHSTAAGFCGLPCVLAKLEHGTPYLLTEHGVYLREQYLNLRRHIKSVFVRATLYRLIEAVVTLNYAVADQVSPVCHYNARWERWFGVPPEKVRVIHNGVDPSRFEPDYARTPGPPRVASMGLIYPLKGQLDLVDAAALVRESIPDIQFDIYGSASDDQYYKECLERVDRLNVTSTVRFQGPTTNPAAVYQQADVVALPSISEAFPYAVIEAMLCGAPIVATDVGGVSEALEATGVLVRPGRPREMADAILGLLRSEGERRRLGLAARTRALERFTLETVLSGYRESYARLAAPNECETALPDLELAG